MPWDISVFCDADTERAVGLLRRYQADLTSPEEQTLKNSVGKVSAILGSHLFQALLGMNRNLKLTVIVPWFPLQICYGMEFIFFTVFSSFLFKGK